MDLNKLLNVPFEKWHEHGVRLAAVSANANGIVNSGLIRISKKGRKHFYRSGDRFVIEK
jgi:hypothetical protein